MKDEDSIIKVRRCKSDNNLWEVIEYEKYSCFSEPSVLFKGTICECESFITLKKQNLIY